MREKIYTLDPTVLNQTVAQQTQAFQKLLDICALTGGEVNIPAGVYTIGSVRIYSNTTLKLKSGVVINGATDLAAYQDFGEKTGIAYVNDDYFVKTWHLPDHYFSALICAYDAHDIVIDAEPGVVIDGHDLYNPDGEEGFRGPLGLVFSRVRNLTLQGYVVQNSANWSHLMEGCSNVLIQRVQVNAGHDGFNLQHSQHILIDSCVLHTGDDCVAGYDIDDLKITHCWLNTACNGLRIGGRNISVSDCDFVGPGLAPHLSTNTYDTHSFLKYYAMSADSNRYDGTEIRFSRMLITNCRNLINYAWGDHDNMQDGRPLRMVAFEQTKINKLAQPNRVFGNGEPITVSFAQCEITPTEDQLFMQLDDSVTLHFESTNFKYPATFQYQDGETFVLTGLVSRTIIARNEVSDE